MLRLLVLLVFLSTPAMAAEPTLSLPDSIKDFIASLPGTPRLYQTLKVADGVLTVGIVQLDLAVESFDPPPYSQSQQVLLYIALQHHDGTVSEVAKTTPFYHCTDGGRTCVETIDLYSDTGFSIQFNHLGSCGGGYTIYQFALVRNKWRVAGLDTTNFSCGPYESEGELQSMDYYISTQSVNFLTGLIVETKTEGNKRVSSKRSRQKFPAFPIEQFVPFDEKYYPSP